MSRPIGPVPPPRCVCLEHERHADCRTETICRGVPGYRVTWLACECAGLDGEVYLLQPPPPAWNLPRHYL